MGTRSLTRFLDSDMKPFVAIYQQFDGYPSGVGADIKKCLGSKKMVNGYNDASKEINGINSAVAMFIAQQASATETGGVYIYHPDDEDNFQEYNYDIYLVGADKDTSVWKSNQGMLALKVYRGRNPNTFIYVGLLDDFDPDMDESRL